MRNLFLKDTVFVLISLAAATNFCMAEQPSIGFTKTNMAPPIDATLSYTVEPDTDESVSSVIDPSTTGTSAQPTTTTSTKSRNHLRTILIVLGVCFGFAIVAAVASR